MPITTNFVGSNPAQVRCTRYKLCDKVGQWFSPGIPVSSTNKTDHHDIAEILLKKGVKYHKPTIYLLSHEPIFQNAMLIFICPFRTLLH